MASAGGRSQVLDLLAGPEHRFPWPRCGMDVSAWCRHGEELGLADMAIGAPLATP